MTKYAVMKVISNKIHGVTECNVTDLYDEFPSAKEWVTGFARMSIYGNQIGWIPPDEIRPMLFLIMRRTETAFSEYALAREELQRFISGHVEWSVYYRALYHFEAALGQLYQIYTYHVKKEKELNSNFKLFDLTDDNRGRTASYPTAPSQIPACGITAQGSSKLFTCTRYTLSPQIA